MVVPRYVRTIWERGRYIEYLFAFTFFKPIQDMLGKPLISSGCFSAYRTDVLRKVGGWSTRTLAEDMDLTWTLYSAGWKVRFVEEALCYPIEPHNYHFLAKQLKRWSHGFVQNIRQHWREMARQPYLGQILTVCLWDSLVASFVFLFVIPLLALFVHPLFLAAYLIDMPAVMVPVLVKSYQRGEVGRALLSLPCFVVIRLVNSVFMLRAFWNEFLMGRALLTYEKGH